MRTRSTCVVGVALALVLCLGSTEAYGQFLEDFEDYAAGDTLAGLGGWETWDESGSGRGSWARWR